jgi:hypothetical protein
MLFPQLVGVHEVSRPSLRAGSVFLNRTSRSKEQKKARLGLTKIADAGGFWKQALLELGIRYRRVQHAAYLRNSWISSAAENKKALEDQGLLYSGEERGFEPPVGYELGSMGCDGIVGNTFRGKRTSSAPKFPDKSL